MRIAAYIDADNISADQTERAISILNDLGEIRVIRAYGNWSSKSGRWKTLVNRHGILASHRYNVATGKNAADIDLTVDAMAGIHGQHDFDTLAIVSSDSDFLPLVQHARACGKRVVGLGCLKAPTTYASRCDWFHYLDSQEMKLVAV